MKKWIIGLVLLFFIAFYLAGKSIPHQLFIKRISLANAGSNACLLVFTEMKHISNWWPKTKNTDSAATFFLPRYEGYLFELKKINDNNILVLIISSTDTITTAVRLTKLATEKTSVEWSCTVETKQQAFTNLFYYVKAQKIRKLMDELLLQAKQYAENSSQFYGYHIVQERLVNDIVTVGTATTAKATLYPDIKTNFEKIVSYINKNKLTIKGNYMLRVTRLPNDSILFMTGIPTATYSNAEGFINHMQMPMGGSLATTLYKGPYKEREKVYAALEKFVIDKELSKASLPYEMLLNNQLPTSDTSVVSLKICYPVF